MDYDFGHLKLEIFGKDHKLAKSLPVHREALEKGLRLPKIIHLECKNGNYWKVTEWVEGVVLEKIDSSLVDIVFGEWAKYVCEMFDMDEITPVDCHLRNFVWTGEEVVYVDMKKLLKRSSHLFLMAKICLKSCKRDRRRILAFLRGYSKIRDVRLVIAKCDELNWSWRNNRNNLRVIEPIKLEEL